MGVAGVALLYGIISFFKMIAAFARFNAWKKKGVPCRAYVAGIANQMENYKGKKGATFYRYALNVEHQGAWVQTFFEETVGPNDSPKFIPGAQTTLLYDPVGRVCKDEADLKGDIKSNAITVVVCIAVFIGCFLIVNLING